MFDIQEQSLPSDSTPPLYGTEEHPVRYFGSLPLIRLRFQIRLPSSAKLPEYSGFAWRGLLGPAIQKLVCPFIQKPDCETDCLLKLHCPYPVLYRSKSSMSGQEEPPKGYVFFSPPSQVKNPLTLEITLFGSCCRFIPVLVESVYAAGKMGLTKWRTPYDVLQWELITPQGVHRFTEARAVHRYQEHNLVFPLSTWMEEMPQFSGGVAHFITPLCLRKEHRHLNQVDWTFFFDRLMNRLDSLNCQYNNRSPVDKGTKQEMKERYSLWQPVRENLRPLRLARYSSTQNKKINMNGLVGTVLLRNCSPELAAWWQLAGLVHVGKWTVMGMGKIVLETES